MGPGGGGGLKGGHPGPEIINPWVWIPNGSGGGDLKGLRENIAIDF